MVLKGDLMDIQTFLVEVSKSSIFYILFLMEQGEEVKNDAKLEKWSDHLRSFILLQACHFHWCESKRETYGLG